MAEQHATHAHEVLLKALLDNPESGIRNVAEDLGTLRVVGSYALGLMSRYRVPDVDMNLLVSENTDLVTAATQAGQTLISGQAPWHKFEVYDNRKARRPAMPDSVYLGLKAYTPSTKVEADIWLFDNERLFNAANNNHDTILTHISAHPEDRQTILAIKESLDKTGGYFPSYGVYRAVIEHGVSTVEQLLALSDELKDQLTRYDT